MSFEKAVLNVLWEETGGDDDGALHTDPQDPGGTTKWGIAQRFHKDVNVATLTRKQAVDIYRRKYWDALSCGDLPPALALLVFDCAVNPGEVWAATALQHAMNACGARLLTDGVIGPKTIRAARGCDVIDVAQHLSAARAIYYASRKNFERYKNGWMLRTMRTLTLTVTE